MITIKNYYTELDKINGATLPIALQKGWTFVNKVTEHGRSWDAYHASDSIKNTIDLYIKKLNEYVSSTSKAKSTATPKKVVSKTVKTKSSVKKTSPKKKITIKKKTNRELAYERATKVERISDELRMIKRFVLMHDKVKTQNQIRLFISALQKAIAEKRIRKTSDYAKEINEVQNFLINLHGRFRTESERIHVVIGDKKRSHYLTLVGKQAELRSVKFIKSYINLQGKSISNVKAKNLYNRIANAMNNGKLSKKDRYWNEVDQIMSTLKSFVKKNVEQGELVVSSKELNGLQGIIAGCACDELNGIQFNPRNTIMSSTDIVNLEHVLPQNPSNLWNYISDEDRALYCKRIGNLALLITPINTEAGNDSFEFKKQFYDQSEYLLTKNLAAYQLWDKDSISNRQVELANLSVKAWPLK